jgi:ubiquitin C-terminal hydrolase
MQGLENLGSTCAINSLVQIICRNHYLRNIILEYELSKDGIVDNLKEILILMHEKQKSLRPRKFINNIFKILNGTFKYGEQIDIYELWLFLSQEIIKEINEDERYHSVISDIKITDTFNKGLIINNDNDFAKLLLNNSPLKNKFLYYNIKLNNNKISKYQSCIQGYFLNIITCLNCYNTLYNFESFITLNLNIINSNNSIVDMINELYKEDVRCDDWKCENCNKNSRYKKECKIWDLPKVLIIIVNRFSDITKKNEEPININDVLNFKKGTILNNINLEKKYYLSSLALHMGNVDGGHYVAICNNDTSYYNLYNDINVSNIDNFKIDNKYAYMIVYNKL